MPENLYGAAPALPVYPYGGPAPAYGGPPPAGPVTQPGSIRLAVTLMRVGVVRSLLDLLTVVLGGFIVLLLWTKESSPFCAAMSAPRY